jgi:hypothetical protein
MMRKFLLVLAVTGALSPAANAATDIGTQVCLGKTYTLYNSGTKGLFGLTYYYINDNKGLYVEAVNQKSDARALAWMSRTLCPRLILQFLEDQFS